MGFFGFGKKKEKEQQSAQAEETRLEAQADETSGAENAQTAEFLLPEIIAQMLSSGRGDVRVLPTQDAWFGMTYASDREMARNCVKKLILKQVYPEKMD